MNILFVERPFQFGGSLTGLLETVRNLDAGTHASIVCFYDISKFVDVPSNVRVYRLPQPVSFFGGYGIEVQHIVSLFFFLVWRQLVKPFDLVVGNNAIAQNYVFAIAAWALRIPFVSFEKGFAVVLSRMPRFVMRHGLISRHIASSESIRTCLEQWEGTAGKIDVIWEPISANMLIRESHPSAGPVVLGMHSTLAHWKGHENFLQALSVLRQLTEVSFRAEIICPPWDGSGRAKGRLKALASELGLNELVKFKDFFSDVSEHLEQIDISVHVPDEPEPFGRVVAESMMAGLPVIVGEGGPAEYVAAADCGFAVPPRSPHELAKALKTMLASPELRKNQGKNAKEYALRHFTGATVGENFSRAFRVAVGE